MTGQDDDAGAVAGPPSPNLGVKKGLPGRSLKVAEASAEVLWQVARNGVVAHDAYAKKLGMTGASGGGWRRRLALVRAFGLVEATKTDIGLSEIGHAVVQTADAARRLAARRQAFFKVQAYADLVASYDGTELPAVEHIAAKLQYDFGKTPEAATEAAQAFVESLGHAGLLDNGDIVRKAGAGSGPPIDVAEVDPVDVERTDRGHDDEDEDEDEDEGPWDEEDLEDVFDDAESEDPGVSGDERVTLALTLDLSHFRSDEVIEILVALGLASPKRA